MTQRSRSVPNYSPELVSLSSWRQPAGKYWRSSNRAVKQFCSCPSIRLLPICAIASPSSLVVKLSSSVSPGELCTNVSSLDFFRSSDNVWGGASMGTTELCYWGYEEDTMTWYYDQPSFEFTKIAQLWFPSTDPLPAGNPCPAGTNCTYNISFDGPAYQCNEEADFDGTSGQSLDLLPPTGNVLYTCSQIQSDTRLDGLGVPDEWNSIPKNDSSYGVFTREWPMWIGYVRNTTRPAAANSTNNTLWPFELERKVLKCTLNYATYHYNFSFENGHQVVSDPLIDFKGPLLPDGQSMSPQNHSYKQFA